MIDRARRLAPAVLVIGAAVCALNRAETAAADIEDPNPSPPRIPERLPAFSLPDLAGKPTSIRAWSGKSLLINFWATWCAPCRQEIPMLEALGSDWADRGVQVIGIAVDRPERVSAYARKLKIEYPVLVGDRDALDVAAALGFASPVFPFTVFTDRSGEVVALYVGELHVPQARLILSVVEELNSGRIGVAQARRRIATSLRGEGASN